VYDYVVTVRACAIVCALNTQTHTELDRATRRAGTSLSVLTSSKSLSVFSSLLQPSSSALFFSPLLQPSSVAGFLPVLGSGSDFQIITWCTFHSEINHKSQIKRRLSLATYLGTCSNAKRHIHVWKRHVCVYVCMCVCVYTYRNDQKSQ